MKVPHTIPQHILRAYTRKRTPEELEALYANRVIRSEDPTWNVDKENGEEIKTGAMAETAINKIISRYPFFAQLTDELNKIGSKNHTDSEAKWAEDLINYRKRRASYERKMLQQEVDAARRLQHPESDDDDDDDDFPRIPKEPVYVPDEYPEFIPLKPVLDRLSDLDRMQAIEEIDLEDTPLELAFRTIPDEYYWERAAQDRFPDADTDNHGGSWRRLYAERHLRNAIEEFHPFDGDWDKLNEQIVLTETQVRTIVLNNLIPLCFGILRKPIIPAVYQADEEVDGEEDEGFNESEYMVQKREMVLVKKEVLPEEEEEQEEVDKPPRDNTHVDLSLILPKITQLQKLSIIYEMAETGLDWEARFFDFTDKDCEILAKTLTLCPTIEIFELQRSRVTDEQTKTLVREGLLNMPHLKTLNLSYNNLEDAGAKAIARLITDETSQVRNTLRTLILARCHIKNKGAKALAYALTLNSHLTSLDIRLNRFRNSGGKHFGHALVDNKTLVYLNLAANLFTDGAAYILGKMLFHNSSLKELDLSSNNLGKKGGEYIALGVRGNKTILEVDVRLTNIGLDFEYDIWAHINKNRVRCPSFSFADRDELFPLESAESGILEDDEGEDEEEEEEEEEEIIVIKAKKDSDDDASDDDVDGVPEVNLAMAAVPEIPDSGV